ncbi:MAG: isoleucine--tRNA ligase [Demequinaceae bacterium]|nr:isoleucine--tRNA ligase [Demequinaceae bacterium]
MPQKYPLHREGDVVASPRFPSIERDVLAYWKDDGTFQASIDNRPAETAADEFVFYDGPPFANGLPHYGHLLTGYAKDVVPRYQTMRGKRVERRFGWDTHGLPAELEAERVLGITDKSEIEAMGIGAFNDACRESVLKYTKEWEEYVTRQARWVDFENDYKTLDLGYMESVIWGFKQLYDKGLAYEGYRVLPYCWKDETPLSNHELRMDDDVYQSRQDPAITVALRLLDDAGEPLVKEGKPVSILIWTTTPWTLPSNLAVAMGPEISYAVVEPGPDSAFAGQRLVLAEGRVEAYSREFGEGYHVVASAPGSHFEGFRYAPLFPFFADHDDAFRVLTADFVTTEDGTGIVHLAPGFGEDDLEACKAAGIETVVPLDSRGRFTSEVPDWEGELVFDANPKVIVALKEAGVVVRHETYEHPYPHCWRCRNPLIYRAMGSWFIRVTDLRDRMVELNQEITWVPEHLKDGQFGLWLEGARDWSISRNRYFGTPIPVWVSDDPAHPRIDVYGSIADLERDFSVPVTDLHRPYIDELTRPNPDDPTGTSTMRRIPDVLDVWFDSGSMPFAQVHYPAESQEWFEDHYPGDFIVEYIGQVRGWFYTLHVLATAIFDKPAFKNCVCHGIVLGSDGRKMSKSLRNYPDVNEVFDRDGADAMRWFLMSSPILRGGNLIVTEEGIRESVRGVLLPLWSTYYFFSMYAGAVGGPGGAGYLARRVEDSEVKGLAEMDRYVLARTASLVDEVTSLMDTFDVPDACHAVEAFLDLLTNWYVRTQRDRFWNEEEAAFNTLYTVLETLCRVAAPLAPLITEEVWRGLTGDRSVHLTDWPTVPDAWRDESLGAVMDEVREACSVAHGLRKARQIRVRQPIHAMRLASLDPEALLPYADIVRTELNVKNLQLSWTTKDSHLASAEQLFDIPQFGITESLTVNARIAGPRLGKAIQAVIAAGKAGEWEQTAQGLVVGGVLLEPGEYELTQQVGGLEDAGDRYVCGMLSTGGYVVLDTRLTPELEAEGFARDVIRAVQEERRNAGLNVSDRIRLALTVPAERLAAVEEHRDLISRETLAYDPASGEVLIDAAAGPELTATVVKR